jgi:hypothetical protein
VKAPPRRPTAVDHAVELTGELAAYARGEVGVIHPRLVLDLREHDEALRPDRRIVPTQSDDSSWIDTRHRGDDPLDVLRVVVLPRDDEQVLLPSGNEQVTVGDKA